MADAKEILQFGIEAARDGNREEARNLFTLLTKQDPNNIQAWLWLAGVSDTPTQRRNALERALQSDPHNEMALHRFVFWSPECHTCLKCGACESPSDAAYQRRRRIN